jgi:hypothetical protein
METNPTDDRRALVDRLPQFLTRALCGWDGLTPLLVAVEMERPAFFLLRALVQERDAGESITRAGMQAELFNPYSTIRPILDSLPVLVERGYVADANGRYGVTRDGREFIAHAEGKKNQYLASLTPVPAADIARLAEELMTVARRLRDAPEPEHTPHQARAWRAMPPADAAPMVRLYGAVYALWMARDDCHNAAWRGAGFDGPPFDLLSRVWSGDATTAPALTEAVQEFQRPEDVERGIASLVVAAYLTRDGESVRLTRWGTEARDQIEEETDRRYFGPWLPLPQGDLSRMRTEMETIIAGLPV